MLAAIRIAPPQMPLASIPAPATHGLSVRTPVRLLQGVSGLLILILLAVALFVLLRLREDALLSTEKHISAIALTLAEQADRAVQGMDT